MDEFAATHIDLDAQDTGERLDKVLARHCPALSRSRIKALMQDGHVRMNGAVVRDPSLKLRTGAVLDLDIPPPKAADPEAEDIALAIVHEDEHLIVIDKPAGLVVHPAAGHARGTLVNALLHHCGASLSGINGVMRPGIVHRLDKDTSGLMVVAKTDAAHRGLAEQFADHGRTGPLERSYLAFCWGAPLRRQGTVEAAIARSTVNREKMAIVAEDRGRYAITHYTVDEVYAGEDGKPAACLVACMLETGRTHQIRLHMASIGHPILADDTYGAGFRTKIQRLGPAARAALEGLDRQALHAAELGFEHPVTGETLHFTSALPPDLQALADALAG